jgi:hypothetical protein
MDIKTLEGTALFPALFRVNKKFKVQGMNLGCKTETVSSNLAVCSEILESSFVKKNMYRVRYKEAPNLMEIP